MTGGLDSELSELDGRLLLVFRELLRHRNATTVAERLHLSQSTVSYSLGRLRRLHGDELFVRRPHGLEPTRRALQLAPLVEDVLASAGKLLGRDRTFDPETSGYQFSVAASEFATALIGGELLRRWRTAAPGVSLVTHQLAPGRAEELVRRGELDSAVGRFAGEAAPGLERTLLFVDDYCVVARRDHPGIDGAIDRTTYLVNGHVIAASPSESYPGEPVPRQLTVTAVVPAWLTALVMVASSDAIATCPRRLAEQQADRLALQIVELPAPVAPIEVFVLRRGEAGDRVDWLVAELEAVTTG